VRRWGWHRWREPRGRRRLAGGLRPVAAGEVGQDKERFPDVGSAIVQTVRDLGPGGRDELFVVEDEAPALVAEGLGVEVAEAFALFAGSFAFHAKNDATVRQGFGEVADGGEDFGAPGGVVTEAK